ncbi:hypothetical protein ABL78_4036 [Leptomonas seymouri]|uniref:Uncharacterized protein n=1 Tax=Leptomonas seymouri TaxID=5684 RepID=A0A0N1I5C4_LEPSE|nr:hypothetical protein ABL78_4036 [Leptomonas seymouri]|eukprot:KPI86902.1 hypothetical protein ABL78_4036 [Leptomonas seymouri]
MAEKHFEAASLASATQATSAGDPIPVAVLDRKTVQALFAALRTSIPADVQQNLLRDSLEELKFLIARQPRLSSFHHRRRESLRHPALAMATKNYYQHCRRKRLELAVQIIGAGQQEQQYPFLLNRADAQEAQADGTDTVAAQRESELVDLLLAEYARSGSFQEEYGAFNRHGNSTNISETSPFSTSVTSGSPVLGNTSAQLLTSTSAIDVRNSSFTSESRIGTGTFVTEVGNIGSEGTNGAWRSGQSIMHRGSISVGNHATLADGMGIISHRRLSRSFTGRTNSIDSGSVGGHSRTSKASRGNAGGAGRFFSKRHDLAEGGAGGARGGGSRDGGARWGAEMLSMVIHRAEEELKAGSSGDPYLLTSSRPIEVLLTCYGGVQRDPAVMALGAASLLIGVDNFSTSTTTTAPAEADALFNAVVDEDLRWDQLAQCYRQLLREANSVRQAAAAAVAHDPLVNDIIRRFWERLTVSPAAQQAHKAQEAASRKRDAGDADAFSKRTHSRSVTDEADEDDLDEIQKTAENAAEPSSGGGGASARGSRSTTRPSSGAAKRGKLATPRKVAKGKGKKKKGGSAGLSTKAAEPASTVAYYMTPLQYVYLHTRMAHVLLPESNALDMELLYFIQEDLLVDAAYSESDAAQPLYFGEAPRLLGLNGMGKSRGAEKRHGGKDRFAQWQEDDGINSDDEGQSGPALRQRFLEVRRHGYALDEGGGVINRLDDVSVMVRKNTITDLGTASDGGSVLYQKSNNAGGAGGAGDGEKDKETATNALLLVNMCFRISELPSLTFQQFWCSMMELADNWTCCAGHPTETAIFLWELYAEVFGNNWGAEDEALVTALSEKAAAVSKAERAKLDAEVSEALRSFEDLVKALRERERVGRQLSSSGTFGGRSSLHGDDRMLSSSGRVRRRRRRHGTGKSATSSLSEDMEGSFWSDSWMSSDSDLSLSEWNALAHGKGRKSMEWVYIDRVDGDGVKRRYRRRIVHHQRRRRRAYRSKDMTLRSSARGDGMELSFVLEEELGADDEVVRQRKRRCREVVAATMARIKGRRRNKPHKGGSLDTISTPFYERRHRYEEHNAKRLRRLESRRRVEAGSSLDSSLTSWSSIDDGTTEDRRNGRRRRGRIRRTGPRRNRLRDLSDTDEEWSMSFSSDDWEHRKGSKRGGKAGQGTSSPKSHLSPEELEELLANKEWLCTVLGAKGICLPQNMFDDPAERVLLYELLRLTKESEARGGDGVAGGPGLAGLFNIDGEGSGGADLSRLAALLSQSAAFNLEALNDSALMRRLLGEDGDGSKLFLSPHQLQGVLLALVKGQHPGGGDEVDAPIETEGMRRRRLYLLRMLEERRAREEQLKQQKQSKEDAHEGTLPPTERAERVRIPAKSPTPNLSASNSRPGFGRPQSSSGIQEESVRELYTDGLSVRALKIPSPPPTKGRLLSPQNLSDSSNWVLSPTTAAERRELERLFHELEAYWAYRLSHRGRYRVHLTEYTKEQLEEFFAHLHLGSRQRALLRGRAPLAGATSLVGGTLHQDTARADTQDPNAGCGVGSASAAARATVSAPPLAAAPVKLFTLTTEASLDGALRESYVNYLNDKAFSESCRGAVFKVEQPPSAPPPPQAAPLPDGQERQQKTSLPRLSQSGRLRRQNSALAGASQGTARQPTAAVAAAPAVRPPSSALPPQLLPALTSVSRDSHNQSPSSANSISSLPKV